MSVIAAIVALVGAFIIAPAVPVATDDPPPAVAAASPITLPDVFTAPEGAVRALVELEGVVDSTDSSLELGVDGAWRVLQAADSIYGITSSVDVDFDSATVRVTMSAASADLAVTFVDADNLILSQYRVPVVAPEETPAPPSTPAASPSAPPDPSSDRSEPPPVPRRLPTTGVGSIMAIGLVAALAAGTTLALSARTRKGGRA